MNSNIYGVNIPISNIYNLNLPSNSFLNDRAESISFFDPNSLSISSDDIDSNTNDLNDNISNDIDDNISSSIDDNISDDVISPQNKYRLSLLSTFSRNTNNTIKLNDIYERQKYIDFMIKQNTYLNNAKYQYLFNQIIFNFKL